MSDGRLGADVFEMIEKRGKLTEKRDENLIAFAMPLCRGLGKLFDGPEEPPVFGVRGEVGERGASAPVAATSGAGLDRPILNRSLFHISYHLLYRSFLRDMSQPGTLVRHSRVADTVGLTGRLAPTSGLAALISSIGWTLPTPLRGAGLRCRLEDF